MNFIIYLIIMLIIILLINNKTLRACLIALAIIIFNILIYFDYINYIDAHVLDGEIVVTLLILLNISIAVIKIILYAVQNMKTDRLDKDDLNK